jgi:hypothetical protein
MASPLGSAIARWECSLAKRAGEGDIRAFEKFEKVEADIEENSAADRAASRFEETADKLAMADIVRRIRNIPLDASSSSATSSPAIEPAAYLEAPKGEGSCGQQLQRKLQRAVFRR